MPKVASRRVASAPSASLDEKPSAAELKGEKSNQQFVTALARGIAILRCFSATRTELGTMEIAQMTGLPQPTVWRLCNTLQELGCITPAPYSGKLQVGMGLLGLGFSALSSVDITDLALAEMHTIAEDFGAAVSLTIAEPLEMLIVKRAQGNGTLVANLNPGSRISMATSAAGWAYLASLSEEARTPVLRRLEAYHRDKWTAIKGAIDNGRQEYDKLGFTLNVGVFHPDINSVAVAVRDMQGAPIYVLNGGGAATVLPVTKLREEIAPRLKLLANRMQAALTAKAASSAR